MKINFTKKEYRRLLDLVYLGDWMLNAHKVGPDDRDRGYDEVLQKIYAQAEAMGCEELISDSQVTEGFAPTLTFEESGIDEVIGEYNDSIFWEELIDRLSARDALAEAELKGHSISSIGEFFEWIEPYEEKYAKEIDEHGLTRLGVWTDGTQV